MDKKISQLTALTTADQADVYAIVDTSATETKKITQQDVEDSIANSTNFVDQLVANSYFTTELANDANFVSELTTNSTFQTSVNNFITAGGGGSGGGGTKLAVNTTPVTIASSAVETSIIGATIPIPANTLGTNNAIRFNIIVSNFQLDTGDVYVKLKYGATTIGQVLVLSDSLDATKGIISGYIVANGATNSQKGFLNVGITNQDVEASGAAAVNISKFLGSITGTAAEDSTTALNLNVTVTFSNGTATNTITTQATVVEQISSTADNFVGTGSTNNSTYFNIQIPFTNTGTDTGSYTKPWSLSSSEYDRARSSYADLTGNAVSFYLTSGILPDYTLNNNKDLVAQYIVAYEASDTTDSYHGITEAATYPGQSTKKGAYFFNDGGVALYAVTNDGSTANQIAVTGITLTNRNVYRIETFPTAGTPSVKFYVNGVLKATSTANLPFAATTAVGFGVIGIGNNTHKLNYMSAPTFTLEI